MDHNDHVNLLRPADLPPGGTWADLGAGSGAFTLALRELLGPGAHVHAVDRDAARLEDLVRAWKGRFGDIDGLRHRCADFSRPLDLPPLDGIVMANSLHFFADQERILRHVHTLLQPDGALLLVEYDSNAANRWVPYPLPFSAWLDLAPRAGFERPRLLATHPSGFMGGFYAAQSRRVG